MNLRDMYVRRIMEGDGNGKAASDSRGHILLGWLIKGTNGWNWTGGRGYYKVDGERIIGDRQQEHGRSETEENI